MDVQTSELSDYLPRSTIIRELERRIGELDRLDAERNISVHRLLFKLRGCRGPAAVAPVEEALMDLQRQIADGADADSIDAARELCIERILTVA